MDSLEDRVMRDSECQRVSHTAAMVSHKAACAIVLAVGLLSDGGDLLA